MTLVYLDASALVKLVLREEGSAAVVERVVRSSGMVSCLLAAVEVPRAVRRMDPDGDASTVLSQCTLVQIAPEIIEAAASLPPKFVRSLDAIHVATALHLGAEVEAFVTYDRRQAEAARAAGLRVESPGAVAEG